MMNIDDYLIEHKDKTYMLEVKGDSMIDAGIQEGDLVVAERSGEAEGRRHCHRRSGQRMDDEIFSKKGRHCFS